MYIVKLSTPEPLPILLVDATDGYTEEPGLAPVVTIRKAGGAFAAALGAASVDRGNGSYEYTPTAAELNTLGVLEYRATGVGARTYRGAVEVCSEKPGQLAAAAIGAATFAAGAIDAAAIANGAIDAATFAAGAIDAAAIANGAIDAATFAAGAINAAAIATGAIDADAIAADAVTEIQAGLATAAALATVQADTDDIQTRLPAALVAGRMDSSVGAMALNVLTAAALAADAVAEIQVGLATSAAVAAVQADTDALQVDTATIIAGVAAVNADTDNIQTRIPAALVAGRMDASVGAMAANVLTAAATAADYVTEVQAGLATAAAVAALPTAALNADAVWDELIAGHLGAGSTGESLNASGGGATPSQVADAVWDELRADHVIAGSFGQGAASVQGNVTGSVASVTGAVASVTGAVGSVTAGVTLAANAVNAAALSADAGTEIAAAVDATLTAAHGAGSWVGGGGGGGPTAAEIADAVLSEIVTDHSAVAGSLAQAVMLIKGLSNGNVLHDTFIYDTEGKLTSCRIRVFPTAGDVGAGTNVIATFTVTAVNGAYGPTNYRVTQS